MIKKNLGGDRLGSGNKMEIEMHGFQRSNHDQGFIFKNTQAPGTLVPFMNILALPGDTFDITLDSRVKTLPTIGPLFGSFKLQLDVFTIPIRLYNKQLHNNTLNVGNNISSIKFPLIHLIGENLQSDSEIPLEFQQINQSSILAYLGMRGIYEVMEDPGLYPALFNAIPYLGYWDIFKNYYANKAEENAYVIHGQPSVINTASIFGDPVPATGRILKITGHNITPDNIQYQINAEWYNVYNYRIITEGIEIDVIFAEDTTVNAVRINPAYTFLHIAPKLQSFPLENIDLMRDELLAAPSAVPYIIDQNSLAPYKYSISPYDAENTSAMYAIMGQEGLAVKTYQSDVFNNWVNTETYENITSMTSISTTGDSFNLDTLNIAKKVYDVMVRAATAGGSLEDYIEAIYDHSSKWKPETPVYHGGLSKEITFEEVISTSETDVAGVKKPLASLAGKGIMTNKHKGGKVIINVDEPSFIMGIVSITPRISYSQGNDWITNLKTMDDLHKPSLDGIGFQDLITQQMAFWETAPVLGVPQYKSAGKQPAWINYMTNYDKNYGHFADPRTMQYMTLDRRYEWTHDMGGFHIKDLTTYIDPAKFNYAFAQSDLSAQNFMVQIGVDIFSRRKMSDKVIPNL